MISTVATKNTYEIHLYLPEEFRELLRATADRENRSVNSLIRVLLDEALAHRGRAVGREPDSGSGGAI